MPPPAHREPPPRIVFDDATFARLLVLLLALAPPALVVLDPEARRPSSQRPRSQRREAPATPTPAAHPPPRTPVEPSPRSTAARAAAEPTAAASDQVAATATYVTISGIVFDPGGQPAEGAHVHVGAASGSAPVEPSASEGTLPPFLHEEAPALVAAVRDLAAEGLGVVPGAVPTLPTFETSAASGQRRSPSTLTAADGRFVLHAATGEAWVLWVYQPKDGSRATLPLSPPLDVSDLKVSLRPPAPRPAADAATHGDAASETTPPEPEPPRLFTLPPVEFSHRVHGVYVSAIGPGAHESPLRPGDRVLRIDGEPILAAAQARSMLRGKRHTRVRLVLLRDGERMHVTLTRP